MIMIDSGKFLAKLGAFILIGYWLYLITEMVHYLHEADRPKPIPVFSPPSQEEDQG